MPTSSNPSTQDLPEELQPCHHMVNLVSRRSDETLTGPAKWYTDFHVMTCPSCKAALAGLRELRNEVASQVDQTPADRPRLSPEDWHSVEQSWSTPPDPTSP